MWSDNETNIDFIDYQHLVVGLKSIIDQEELLPCSIGIFGDWGSGKSSLMKMVAEEYKADKDILTIAFNGWLFEGYEDAKTVLMGRIVDEIIKKRTIDKKALKLASKLLKRIDLMKVSGSALKYGASYALFGPLGVALTSSTDIIAKIKSADYEQYLKSKEQNEDSDESLSSNIQDFHCNFEELIEETKIKKIIVLIDDLDRCSPDTVIGTLEAIKLFLFCKRTVFIIGADERLIKYSVRRRFPEIPGDNTEVGRDYLEKLIQFPVRIPPMNNLELGTYLNLLFTSLHADVGEFGIVLPQILGERRKKPFQFGFGVDNVDTFFKTVTSDWKTSLAVSAQITPVLASGLNGNPRQSKRFLNTLLLRYGMAKSKGENLKMRVLAKLMLLEYFRSEMFKLFYQVQAENAGDIPWIGQLEKAVTDSDGLDRKASFNNELQVFLQDAWLKNWAVSEPSLKGENLQPYFYFSRDKLTVTGFSLQRMSPAAQEIFKRIVSDAQSYRDAGLKASASVNQAEAAGIFEALAERIYKVDDPDNEEPLLKRLFDFCEVRQELIPQFITLCAKLPEEQIPLSAPTWLLSIAKSKPSLVNMVKDIVSRWSKNTKNKKLAKFSEQKLKEE